jgi:cysteine dioxygenase
MAARILSLQGLVDLLRSTEGAPITSPRIAGLLEEIELEAGSLGPYVRYADDHYTRNLIHRGPWFDVMAICWKPGQASPVHSHNGQLGWVKVLRGALESVEYQWPGPGQTGSRETAGAESPTGFGQVRLQPGQPTVCVPGGGLNLVTQRATIHSLGVPQGCHEDSLSLHIYSLPFDSCVTFDVARGSCKRSLLAFDSVPDGHEILCRV